MTLCTCGHHRSVHAPDGCAPWLNARTKDYGRACACKTFTPEPPRDSGEADAVNGLTALGTHHDIGTKGEPAR